MFLETKWSFRSILVADQTLNCYLYSTGFALSDAAVVFGSVSIVLSLWRRLDLDRSLWIFGWTISPEVHTPVVLMMTVDAWMMDPLLHYLISTLPFIEPITEPIKVPTFTI